MLLAKAGLARVRAAKVNEEHTLWKCDNYDPGDQKMWSVEPQVNRKCVRFQGVRTAYFTLDKDSTLTAFEGFISIPLNPKSLDVKADWRIPRPSNKRSC